MLRTALCVFLFAAVAAAATGGPTVPLYNAAQVRRAPRRR